MKYSKDDYQVLKNAIAQLNINNKALQYKEYGLSFTRFMWDCYHYGTDKLDPSVKAKLVYADYNDKHIETALKRIMIDFGIEKW